MKAMRWNDEEMLLNEIDVSVFQKNQKSLPAKSAPVQNALPTPVMIPTHKLSSSSNNSHILAICRLIGKSTQFNFSGLLSVTCTMRSWGKEM